jgi:hypothetical protein
MKQRRCYIWISVFFLPWRNSPSGPRPPHYRGFVITLRHSTLSRTPLEERSYRRRDLSPTTHKRATRDKHPCPRGIRTQNPSKREAADPRLILRGHWDQGVSSFNVVKIKWLMCIVTRSLLTPELYDVWNIRTIITLHLFKYVCISVSKRFSTLSDTWTPLLPIFPLAFI